MHGVLKIGIERTKKQVVGKILGQGEAGLIRQLRRSGCFRRQRLGQAPKTQAYSRQQDAELS